ncbi:MAG TPA: hypothetical protein VF624_04370 [Tepidisphaeraceae bacterium]|jgi:hypothetical protein
MARTATKSAAAASAQPPHRHFDSSAAPTATPGNSPPVHRITYRNIRAAIWLNDGQKGPFYSVTFSRSYQDDQNVWHDATSFSANDLPLLAKLANDCHSWIAWQTKRAADEASRAKGGT